MEPGGQTSGEEDTASRRRKRGDASEDTSGKLPKTESASAESCLDSPVDFESVHEVVTYEPSKLPAKHYDADSTEPISYYLNSLEELLAWRRSEANPFNMASVPLVSRQPPFASCQKRTLVCHDMMGGYLEDRFTQGAEVQSPYAFYHWNCIDIFNYFSHHTVTIPPAVWTNAAHRHGVLSLGTFITEWTDGEKLCEVFLADEESYRTAADKLVQIAHCYGFDGWLINIENTLSATAVKNTSPFLRYLTDQMHERVPGSQVIWYDSVLEDGALKWQNELNAENRVFFEACDGIFTNYNWTEGSLERMVAYSAAAGRMEDIYVGVDVFARGDVVGGKFDTKKALTLVRKHGLSTAIFAPGWVYECHDREEFRHNQDKFWGLLSNYLFVHRIFSPLPFVSSFCQGFGKRLYWRGQLEMERSWFNLSGQELQPLFLTEEMDDGGRVTTRGCPDDAWTGGNCLLVEGTIPSTLSKICARIFSVHVPLAKKTFVSFVYKPSLGVSVSLELKTTDSPLCTFKGIQDIPSSSVLPEPLVESHPLVQQFFSSCGQWRTEGWTSRCFQLELRGCALRDVCVNVIRDGATDNIPFSCKIGEIMVLDAESLLVPTLPVKGICVTDVVWRKAVGEHRVEEVEGHHPTPVICLSATLRWHYPPQLVRHFRIHWRRLRGPDPRVPPGPLVLIGRTYSALFRVVELEVSAPPGLVELLVEPVTREGFTVPESQWGRSSLSYTAQTPANA